MTVYKNIAFGLENMKWDKEKIRKRVEELLDTLKIQGIRGPLSGRAFRRSAAVCGDRKNSGNQSEDPFNG